MGQKTCTSCGGSGSYTATERVPDFSGGMFREISVRKSCFSCGGAGTIWVQDADGGSGGSGGAGKGDGTRRGHGIADLGQWCVTHLWPLNMADKLGQSLRDVGWKVKAPLALLGAILGAGLMNQGSGAVGSWADWARMTLMQVAGESAGLVAVCLGALVGWLLPSIIGGLMMASAQLVGVGIALAIVAAVLGIIYVIIASIQGWPPFANQSPLPFPQFVTDNPDRSR